MDYLKFPYSMSYVELKEMITLSWLQMLIVLGLEYFINETHLPSIKDCNHYLDDLVAREISSFADISMNDK